MALFGILGEAEQVANTDVQVLSPFKVDMGNVLAKDCLFTHLADTEQLFN